MLSILALKRKNESPVLINDKEITLQENLVLLTESFEGLKPSITY
jgi:hypothetical protein